MPPEQPLPAALGRLGGVYGLSPPAHGALPSPRTPAHLQAVVLARASRVARDHTLSQYQPSLRVKGYM